MAKLKGSHQAVYNLGGQSLPDGAETGLFLTATGALMTSGSVSGMAASNAAASGNPVLVGAQYNATLPTFDDGDAATLQADAAGRLIVTLGTLLGGEDLTNNVLGVAQKPVVASSYSPLAFTAQLNDVDISVKGSAGMIKSITVTNINAAVRYLQVHNKATAPAAGETAVMSFVIPAGTATAPAIREIGTDFFGEAGYYLSTGIAIGISTVAATFTAATTTDHTVNGTYF